MELVGYWLMMLVVTIFIVIITGNDFDCKEKIEICLGEAILTAMLIIAIQLITGGK